MSTGDTKVERQIRSCQNAIDKIAAMDAPEMEKAVAIARCETYAHRISDDIVKKLVKDGVHKEKDYVVHEQ